MDNKNRTIILYSEQTEKVINVIEQENSAFSKKKYVVSKYEESAPIFTVAYDWFVKEAIKYVDKPIEAEYPYWAFKDIDSIEKGASNILKLEVPIEKVIFFNMYDWIKILNLKYLGENEKDELEFKKQIESYGIKLETDILLTNFYPDLKKQIIESWSRLFKHHFNIKNGSNDGVDRIQVALWQIKKEWIIK